MTDFITKEFCNERNKNLGDKIQDLKDYNVEKFDHVNKKLDKLLNGGQKQVSYKVILAIVGLVNATLLGVMEIIKALIK